MTPPNPTFLDQLLDFIINADTIIAILIFLVVGVVSTLWQLAIQPLLLKFSKKYRVYSAEADLDRIKPLLRELGLVEESRRIRSLSALRAYQLGRSEEVLKSRLIEIMSLYYSSNNVALGRHHSQPNSYFIDLRAAAMDVNSREILADVLANFIANDIRNNLTNVDFKEYNRIIGIKEGNPLMTAVVAQKLQLPLALYRGTDFPRFHGSTDPVDFFDGKITLGENVILVDDATFRGTTLISATKLLTSMNIHVVGIFLLFEPNMDLARNSFKSLNIHFHSVIKVNKQIEKELKKKVQ